jgi:hypothetical protein
MTQRPDDDARARRAERLGARLRENLQRRKAQARARRAGDEDGRDGLSAAGTPVAKRPESDDDVSSG